MGRFGLGSWSIVGLAGVICVLGAACLPSPARAAGAPGPTPTPAPPTASLIPDATAHLRFGETEGKPKLMLIVAGISDKAAGKPDPVGLIDITASETTVGPIAFKLIASGATSRVYELELSVKGLPRNATQTRTLAFTVGGGDKQLTYTLTNVSAFSYGLTLKPPPAGAALDRGAWIPVGAVVGALPLTGVKLLQSVVIEKNTKRPLTKPRLQLCLDPGSDAQPNPQSDPKWKPAGPCDNGQGVDLAANKDVRLWLGPADAVGTYENQAVTIASDQKLEGELATLTFFVSSWGHKALGVFFILLGVAVAWVPMVYVRGRLSRDQAYLPVFAVRETLEQLDDALRTKVKAFDVKQTRDRIQEQHDKLDDKELKKNGLPALVASPFAIPGAPDVEKFRQYVQAVSDWAAVLAVTESALLYIQSKWDDGFDDATKTNLKTFAKALDDIAGGGPLPAPPLADIRTKVAAIRAQAAAAVTPVTTGRSPLPSATVTERAEQQIRVDIAVLSILSWIFIGIVTTVVGAYALVYSPAGAGFGTVADYLIAFFWGLGLPTASQLSTATTSTVSSTFKVTPPA